MTKTQIRRVGVKMAVILESGSNFSDHQLKIDWYEHSVVYMKHIITRNQNL